jgi:hypothetical protein
MGANCERAGENQAVLFGVNGWDTVLAVLDVQKQR